MWYLWMDADLVFLDENFLRSEVHDLISKAYLADKHFIVARDSRPESGIINTGMILIDDSEWSMEFLSVWWSAYNRSLFSDQAVFSFLWRENFYQLEYRIEENILLLPPYKMNSIFPAYLHQEANHPVLHMAGESDMYRKIVLEEAFNVMCSSFKRHDCAEFTEKLPTQATRISTSHVGECKMLPTQLGLTREKLLDIRADLVMKIIHFLVLAKDGIFKSQGLYSVDFLGFYNLVFDGTNSSEDKNFDTMRKMFQEAVQLGYTQENKNVGTLIEEMEVAVEMMKWLHKLAMKLMHTQVRMLLSTDKIQHSEHKNTFLSTVQRSIETAFEYIELIGSYVSFSDKITTENISSGLFKKEKLIKDRHDLLDTDVPMLIKFLEGLSSVNIC